MIADIQERAASAGVPGKRSEEKGNLLEWMVENAQGKEADLSNLASRLMFLSLASVHSTAFATAAAIFDLCTHPEYIEPLREEIMEVTSGEIDFCKEDLHKLWKMDSFLRESQRCNPLTLRTFAFFLL